LYAEFKNETNGLNPPHGSGLLGALAWYHLDSLSSTEKKGHQELAIRGGPWSPSEQEELLGYCTGDAEALRQLLPMMIPKIHLHQALLRGRSATAFARIEHIGIPVDVSTHGRLDRYWKDVQNRLIRELSGEIYEGRSFRVNRFEAFLAQHHIPWPRTTKGRLRLDDDTFDTMSRAYPVIAPIRRVRNELARLRLSGLKIGADGRARTDLVPFGTLTGRCAPSTTAYIFAMPNWLRSLIQPRPGWAVSYCDWSQEEIGIAAVLSRDPALIQAYESGDVYLTFGKQCGLIPPTGTKQSHKTERDHCKSCFLAIGYGMGPRSLGREIGQPTAFAQQLLQLHRETYPRFWAWSDGAEATALARGEISTVFGWTYRIRKIVNPRRLRNYACQANGSELLRLAICLATERGVRVIGTVHDAIVIEALIAEIEEASALTRECMAQASEAVLAGYRLRVDTETIRHPHRFQDPRGVDFWDQVMTILKAIEATTSSEAA
jgi:hypothetical protein